MRAKAILVGCSYLVLPLSSLPQLYRDPAPRQNCDYSLYTLTVGELGSRSRLPPSSFLLAYLATFVVIHTLYVDKRRPSGLAPLLMARPLTAPLRPTARDTSALAFV